MTRALIVTGTDTDIGKTVVSAGLVAALGGDVDQLGGEREQIVGRLGLPHPPALPRVPGTPDRPAGTGERDARPVGVVCPPVAVEAITWPGRACAARR